jgi:hypothetical protein
MTPAPTLTSRTIGETENALRAILLRSLDGTGLDYPRWITLKVASESPAAPDVTELATFVQGGLKIDGETATGAVAWLRSNGILEGDGSTAVVTQRGAELYGRLNDEFTQLTRQMYAGLEVDDLTAAHRVLSTITARANELLAS